MRVSYRCGHGPAGHEAEQDGKGCSTNETCLGTAARGAGKKWEQKTSGQKKERETQGKQWECLQWNALKIENQWTVIITCRRVRNKHIHIYLTPHMCVCVWVSSICMRDCVWLCVLVVLLYGLKCIWASLKRVVLRNATAKAAYPNYTARKRSRWSWTAERGNLNLKPNIIIYYD